MAEIDKLDRRNAIELAKRMRNKMRNLDMDRQRLTERLIAIGIGATAAYAMGWYMGGLEYEYQQNAAAIDAGTMEDPRKVAGVDLDLLVGLGLTAVGVFGGGFLKKGKVLSAAVESAGTHILAGYAYSMGMDSGMESATEAA